MSVIKVLIVDDHPAVRHGLAAVLNKFDDISVIGVAAHGAKALDLCRQNAPDVALIDMLMPQMDGVETITAMKADFPDVAAIMLTHSDRNEAVVKAMDAGAIGYLVKDAEVTEIADAIRAAAAGKRTLSPEALEALIRARTTPQPHPDNQLTDRELDVLRLMARGLKNPEIAEALIISLSTVKFHIGMIFKKLDVSTRTEAVVKALQDGLVDQPDTGEADSDKN